MPPRKSQNRKDLERLTREMSTMMLFAMSEGLSRRDWAELLKGHIAEARPLATAIRSIEGPETLKEISKKQEKKGHRHLWEWASSHHVNQHILMFMEMDYECALHSVFRER